MFGVRFGFVVTRLGRLCILCIVGCDYCGI